MGLFERIKSILSSLPPTPPTPTPALDASFLLPYADDPQTKQQQIWETLEKGILFEDTGVLSPWLTPCSAIDKLAEQRRDSGDRTNWFLGKHQLFDQYAGYVGVMKWASVNKSAPFSRIEEWLGSDGEGHQKFLFLIRKLTNLLGEPSRADLEKFGDLDLGSVEWKSQKVLINLIGIEQFACKYRMYVGLIEYSNR